MAGEFHHNDVQDVKDLVEDIHLNSQGWYAGGPQYERWQLLWLKLLARIYDAAEFAAYKPSFDDAADFRRTISVTRPGDPGSGDRVRQTEFRDNLSRLVAHAGAVLEDAASRMMPLGDSVDTSTVTKIPRIFIAHGGESAARTKVERFVRAVGCEPVIVELIAGGTNAPSAKVDSAMDSCVFALILATKSRGAMMDGVLHPRVNVIDEIPRIKSKFGTRALLLLEKGLGLPTNESDWTYEIFVPQSMDKAFIRIARELNALGVIGAGGIEY